MELSFYHDGEKYKKNRLKGKMKIIVLDMLSLRKL